MKGQSIYGHVFLMIAFVSKKDKVMTAVCYCLSWVISQKKTVIKMSGNIKLDGIFILLKGDYLTTVYLLFQRKITVELKPIFELCF